ncbi:C-type lectin protein [Ranid herpesvirus 3]|uniref:C-type lectin protein n=1 Tax=Ranid herpesvirus 3 TaxID=1987509 RepID=A0A1X9T5G5_9VIRU|nr:C-type lectin protein [Ranid herpesvirus 3]ARR28942.1 C-type lectin protein [Ranid herpesvirus 3]
MTTGGSGVALWKVGLICSVIGVAVGVCFFYLNYREGYTSFCCNAGWLSFNKRCYIVSSFLVDWTGCVLFCRHHNADLLNDLSDWKILHFLADFYPVWYTKLYEEYRYVEQSEDPGPVEIAYTEDEGTKRTCVCLRRYFKC